MYTYIYVCTHMYIYVKGWRIGLERKREKEEDIFVRRRVRDRSRAEKRTEKSMDA